MMANSYGSLCDDFYSGMHINTELDLPCERDTVLTFFDRISRQFPTISNFYRRSSGDFCLEEDRHGETYRWVAMEIDRICSGSTNPDDMKDAYDLHKLVLELSPYMLGVNGLDVRSLDVIFTMDFDFQGNGDEVISDAFFATTAFNCLLELPNTKPVGFSSTIVTALTDDCGTQARVAIESRTSISEVRTNKYKPDGPISLYFTIRQYPRNGERFDMLESFEKQYSIAEELMAAKIIPNFVTPLVEAIAQRRR